VFKKEESDMRTIKRREDIPSLLEAQKAVEGLVEKLELPNGDVILFNEEGLLLDLPVDHEATKLVQSLYTNPTVNIVGNVIHLPKSLNQRVW
jgi:hypothetical protein